MAAGRRPLADVPVLRATQRSAIALGLPSLVARYRREATTLAELDLRWFAPLHEAIQELAVIGVTITSNVGCPSTRRRQ